MVVSSLLLILNAVASLLLFRLISQKKIATLNEITSRKQSLQSKYDFLLGKKLEYTDELATKEKELQTLINNKEGIRIGKAANLDSYLNKEEDMISSYLLTTGTISLEQDHKIRRKKHVLKMSYLATGVTLGFIDLQTSEKLKKGNWEKI
ncbi:MAG: hypothetical protein H0S80_06195 [Desulfovibrionaceae bacterium]|nr:hypothetical protein [Desulfovibrionaceae bacterium]